MTERDFLTLVNSWFVSSDDITTIYTTYNDPFRTTGVNDMRDVVTDVPDNRHCREYNESDIDTLLDMLSKYAKNHKSKDSSSEGFSKPEVSIKNVWFSVPNVTVLWSDGTYTTIKDELMSCAAAEPVVDMERNTVTYSVETDNGFEVFTVSLSEWKQNMFAKALVTKMCSSYNSLVDKWC